MVSSIEIQNYKNLKNITINSLSRVNLIIGKNNTGKTNFLTSIEFYATQNEFFTDKLVIDDLAANLLTDDDVLIPSNVRFVKSHLNIQALLRENSFDTFSDFIKAKAIECLNILDDRILEVDFAADNLRNPVATLKNGKNIALLRMGNGVHRVLTILLALSMSENGIVLIDEIENGLHYAVHEKLWSIIFEIAEQFNIQVFATTHSLDVIRAFGKTINQDENSPLNGLLIKLENIDNVIELLTFDQEELKVITQNSIEVRR